jgi:tetraacyldisaccharide 4'-kinase
LTRDVQFLYTDDWGDLKAAAPLPPPVLTFNRPAIIGASTRGGDEQALIHAWKKLSKPRPLLVLAPRALDRVAEIEGLTTGFDCSFRSRGGCGDADILILDTLGELPGLLPLAHIVFVGGTFDPAVGGHSPTEAAQAGVHIVHGPHTHGNPSAWAGLLTTEVPDPAALLDALAALMVAPAPQPQHDHPSIESILNELQPPSQAKERYHHPLLWPLVPMWRLGSTIHRMTQTGAVSDSRVLVVGGLVNGGAGRTPAAAWLAENLEQSIVLSAGYRRSAGGPSIRFGYPKQTPEHDLGDELEMIRRRGTAVISAPDRAAGIDAANGARTIIIDGGIGDPRLCHTFRIMCVDARCPKGGGPFPVGRARLSWATLRTVDAIWVSNWDSNLRPLDLPPNIPVIHSRSVPSHWLYRGERHPLDAKSGSVAVAVGVAEPSRFVCTLLDLGLTVSELRVVGDHRPLGEIPSGCVVTEKDASRLPPDADVWTLVMETEVTNGEPVIRSFMEHQQ